MKGTDKQIEWAEQIIKGAIEVNNLKMNDAQARYDRIGDQHPGEIKFYEARKAIHTTIDKALQNIDDAKYVIDNRNNIRVATLFANIAQLPGETKLSLAEMFPKVADLQNWI